MMKKFIKLYNDFSDEKISFQTFKKELMKLVDENIYQKADYRIAVHEDEFDIFTQNPDYRHCKDFLDNNGFLYIEDCPIRGEYSFEINLELNKRNYYAVDINHENLNKMCKFFNNKIHNLKIDIDDMKENGYDNDTLDNKLSLITLYQHKKEMVKEIAKLISGQSPELTEMYGFK